MKLKSQNRAEHNEIISIIEHAHENVFRAVIVKSKINAHLEHSIKLA